MNLLSRTFTSLISHFETIGIRHLFLSSSLINLGVLTYIKTTAVLHNSYILYSPSTTDNSPSATLLSTTLLTSLPSTRATIPGLIGFTISNHL